MKSRRKSLVLWLSAALLLFSATCGGKEAGSGNPWSEKEFKRRAAALTPEELLASVPDSLVYAGAPATRQQVVESWYDWYGGDVFIPLRAEEARTYFREFSGAFSPESCCGAAAGGAVPEAVLLRASLADEQEARAFFDAVTGSCAADAVGQCLIDDASYLGHAVLYRDGCGNYAAVLRKEAAVICLRLSGALPACLAQSMGQEILAGLGLCK